MTIEQIQKFLARYWLEAPASDRLMKLKPDERRTVDAYAHGLFREEDRHRSSIPLGKSE